MIKRTGIVSLPLPILLFCLAIPATSHAGAPDTKVHKVGLALSGGGARGAAHIGVLKVLEREGIPIDCIAGTSFGAVVGGLYSLGYSAAEVEQIFNSQDWNNLFFDAPERRLSPLAENRNFRYLAQLSFQGVSPELPTGLWNGQKMVEVLNSLTITRILPSQEDFDRMPIPFRAVATNLLDGTPYVFRKGRLTEALRASVAIPMVFTPVEKDGMLLVDGGLSNNLPTDLLPDMGADILIAVDVTSPLMQKGEIRSFLDVMDQSVSILMKQSVDRTQTLANLTVKPDLEGYSYRDYPRMGEIIARGEEAAEKRIADIRTLIAGLAARRTSAPAIVESQPVIDSIGFEGLHRLDGHQLQREVKSKRAAAVDPNVVRQDLGRLYATRLFSNVDSTLEPVGADRYRLLYLLREAPPNTLGASLRFDRDDKFVALVEATARQLFGTPSSATLSTQFGGIDDDSLAFRYISQDLPFIFLEPKIHLRRRERYDIRDGELVDRFTDRRAGGQIALGSTFFKRLELEIAYRGDKVTIGGGTEPNRMDGSMTLAGLTLRVNRDTLDEPDFPHTGSTFRFQADKRSTALGGDVSFAKYQADAERYFSPSRASSFVMRMSAGYSRGEVPFFDRFYAGGFNYSESGPRRFVGFDRDELVANQMAILTLGYRRQLFSHPLSFTRRAFLVLLYNGAGMSDQRSSPYEFRFYNGAMAGVAIDTLIGPLRIGGAWGEGGRGNFYLSFGPGF